MKTLIVNDTSIEIRRAAFSELIDLRHVVLRGGLPLAAAIFPGDEAATSRHFGAFVNDGSTRAVGCASLHLNQWLDEPAWQLRGMATSSEFRGAGVGRAVLLLMEEELAADPGVTHLLWANARTPAIQFYQRLGWQVVSEQFDIPTAGPHVRILKRLELISGLRAL